MRPVNWFPTRRQVAAGIGASVIALTPLATRAQPLAQYDGGWRILRARAGEARLRGGDTAATAIAGYDGVTPGPLLRIRRGEELRVRLVNELPEPTTIHWHGLRLPNGMDGVPHLTQPPVQPGASFEYRFAPPDAGTFWYHALYASSGQAGRGLYGPLIVDEPVPLAIDRDVTLVLDYWQLTGDGSIAPNANSSTNYFTVNGASSFDVAVKTNERIRLRLINAAAGRMMALRIDGHRADVMAIDGQPAEPFPARDGLVVLGPGNRIDLFIDATLAPGTRAPFVTLIEGNIPLARIVYDAGTPARATLPPPAGSLPANPLPSRMPFAGALKLDVVFDGSGLPGSAGKTAWTVANKVSDQPSPAPLFSIARGRTVMLALDNRTDVAHAVHLHGHHFRLLDRLDDGWKPFWLDSIVVPARQILRIAFVADNPGKWLIHCHRLERRESGIAAWFAVS
jgi:FtsP/CotA-like multicopper oxidase with cupredoxin domain